jgi:hypothetical protein
VLRFIVYGTVPVLGNILVLNGAGRGRAGFLKYCRYHQYPLPTVATVLDTIQYLLSLKRISHYFSFTLMVQFCFYEVALAQALNSLVVSVFLIGKPTKNSRLFVTCNTVVLY